MYKVLLMLVLLVVSGCSLTRQSEHSIINEPTTIQQPIVSTPIITKQTPVIKEDKKETVTTSTTQNRTYIFYIIGSLIIAGIASYKYVLSKQPKIKGIIDMDIQKIKDLDTQIVQTLEKNPWISRKLIVTLLLIGTLIILSQVAVTIAQIVVWPATILGALYIIANVVESIFVLKAKTETKKNLIWALAKDGFTKDDADIVNKVE